MKPEKSRTAIHKEDQQERSDIDVSSQEQVNNLAQVVEAIDKKLDFHIHDNLATNKEFCDKLDKLMPLSDLIAPIERIVADKTISDGMEKRFTKWARMFLTIVGVISAMLVIVQLIFRLEK